MKIAIYARTQDDSQYADAGLRSQIMRCECAAAQYGGTPAIYTDKTPGDGYENRPGLLRLIQDRPEMLVVTSISRLARDMRQLDNILNALSESGTVLLAVNEDILFPDGPIWGRM